MINFFNKGEIIKGTNAEIRIPLFKPCEVIPVSSITNFSCIFYTKEGGYGIEKDLDDFVVEGNIGTVVLQAVEIEALDDGNLRYTLEYDYDEAHVITELSSNYFIKTPVSYTPISYITSGEAYNMVESGVTSANTYTDEQIAENKKDFYNLSEMNATAITELCDELYANPDYFNKCDIIYSSATYNYGIYSVRIASNYIEFASSNHKYMFLGTYNRSRHSFSTQETNLPASKDFMMQITDLTGGTPNWKIIPGQWSTLLSRYEEQGENTVVSISILYIDSNNKKHYSYASGWKSDGDNTYFYFDNFIVNGTSYKCEYKFNPFGWETINWEENTGAVGPQGAQGETGPQGVQGIQGEIGPQGEQGEAGPQGTQGIQGETGPQGTQGVQGEAGPQGVQGIQGETGPQGTQGVQGEAGPQGAQGIQGETGPQGVMGPQGAQGVGGDTAATITSAVTVANAYTDEQIATITGGTVGPQGVQGETGPQGAQGEVGPQGTQGAQGETGPQGVEGPQGETGPQGVQGETGPQGAEGAQGPQGAKGEQGSVSLPNAGYDINPVYISGGTAVACPTGSNSGWRRYVPSVNIGVLEGPEYFDFHFSGSTNDYDARIRVKEGVSGECITIKPHAVPSGMPSSWDTNELGAIVTSKQILNIWTGTQAQYDAITTKSNLTLYIIQ